MVFQISVQRTCKKCEQQLPINSFYQKGRRFDSRCKSCVSKQKKKQYANKNRQQDARLKIKEINVWDPSLSAKRQDFVVELESLLVEEFFYEKRFAQ